MTGEKGKRLAAGVIGLLLAAPFASAQWAAAEGVPPGSGPWKSTTGGCANGAMAWTEDYMPGERMYERTGFDGPALGEDIERRLGRLKSAPQQPDDQQKADTPATIKMKEPAGFVGRWNGGADPYRVQERVEAAPGMKIMTTWTFGNYERTGVERMAQAAVDWISAGPEPAVGEIEFSPFGPCRPNANPEWTSVSAAGKTGRYGFAGQRTPWRAVADDDEDPPFPIPLPGVGMVSYRVGWQQAG